MSRVTNIQDAFLNILRKNGVSVTAYLMNGVPIKGKVTAFDSFVILFEAEGKQHLVFKHAVSTIQPSERINLGSEED